MAFGSRTVAQRDVQFNVNLGQFRAQLGEARSVYDRTTGAMSTEALKLSVGQEKVNRAIGRFGAESLQARQATLALRRDTEALGTQSLLTRDKILSEERALGRFTRGALAGSGAFSHLGRALAFSSVAFLGGTGIVYALRSSVKAAEDAQVAQGQLQIALKDSGLAWGRYKGQIDDALSSQVKTTAFTNDELTTSLALFVRRFGDVNQALRANAIAADVARAKNISLSDAATLVSRASFGNPRSLRILQIELTKTTTNVDALKATTKHATAEQLAAAKAADLQANELSALDAVNAKYQGNAAKYLTTTAGKQALFRAELRRTEEIIGQAVLPELNKLLGHLTRYLEKLNSTGRLEKDVREISHDMGVAFHLAGEGAHYLKDIVEVLKPLFGGVAGEIRAITAALVLFKLRGVLAFKTGAAEIEAASVPLIAAETAAAAGATLPAAGAGAAAAGATGVVAKTGLLRFVAPYAFAAVAGQGYGAVEHLGGPLDVTLSEIPGGNGDSIVLYKDPIDGRYHSFKAKKGTNVKKAIQDDMVKRHPEFGKPPPPAATAHGGGGGLGSTPLPGGGTTGSGGKRGHQLVLGLTEAQQTALYRAEGTKTTADDKAALDAQLAIYNRLIKQHGLNAAQLNSLLQSRDAVISQLDSLTTSTASKTQTAADRLFRHQESVLKTELAQAKQSGHGIGKAVQALIAFYKREEHNSALSQAVRDLARSREIALKKTTDLLFAHRESVLKLAVEKAKLTSGVQDDIAAVKKLEAFYKKEANDPRLKQALRDAFKAKDVAERLVLQKLQKGQKSEFGKLENEFLQAFTTIQSSYGSNVRPTVEVHQHFPHLPTTDGHREARVARIAAQSAFDQ